MLPRRKGQGGILRLGIQSEETKGASHGSLWRSVILSLRDLASSVLCSASPSRSARASCSARSRPALRPTLSTSSSTSPLASLCSAGSPTAPRSEGMLAQWWAWPFPGGGRGPFPSNVLYLRVGGKPGGEVEDTFVRCTSECYTSKWEGSQGGEAEDTFVRCRLAVAAAPDELVSGSRSALQSGCE